MAGLISSKRNKQHSNKASDNLNAVDRSAGAAKDAQPESLMKGSKDRQRIAASISSVMDGWKQEESVLPKDEPYVEERIPISRISLDKDNTRTRHINEFDPTVNSLSKDHPDYEETQNLIDGLKVFADHLRKEPLQNPIPVYKHKNRIWVGPGSRRFLSMKIAFGENQLINVKVYETKPSNLATSRFVENNQREDTSLYVKLVDFKAAFEEVQRNHNLTKHGDVAQHLGISHPNFSRFLSIVSNEILFEKYIKTRRVTALRIAASLVRCKTEEEIEEALKAISGKSWQEQQIVARARRKEKGHSSGRPKQHINIKPIKDMRIAKSLVTGELFKSFEWVDEDFSSYESFQNKLDVCLQTLKEKLKEY